MLRGFRGRQGFEVLYVLLEIPTELFGPVAVGDLVLRPELHLRRRAHDGSEIRASTPATCSAASVVPLIPPWMAPSNPWSPA